MNPTKQYRQTIIKPASLCQTRKFVSMPKGVECMGAFSIKQKQVAPLCRMNFLPSCMRKFKLQAESKKGQRIANFRMRLEELSAEIDHNVSNKMNSLSHSPYP